MATAVAQIQGEGDGLIVFPFAELPKLITLDGTASFDEVGGAPVTAYTWQLVDKPAGSAASLSDAAASAPTITADLPGTYLVFLQVTAGGVQSEGTIKEAPASAFAKITATTQHLAMEIPAEKERGWAQRVNADLHTLDAVGGRVGDLEAADAVQDGQIADNAAAIALLEGAAAPRHHDLLPSFLEGAGSYVWSDLQISGGKLSTENGGERSVWAGRDADGLLQVDIGIEDTLKIAGFMVDAPAGDFRAICDLRLSLHGNLDAKDLIDLCAGFAWIDGEDFSAARTIQGAGVAVRDSALSAIGFGPTPLSAQDLNTQAVTLIDPEVLTGMVLTEVMIRLTRADGKIYPEVSVGGGGWVRPTSDEWTNGGAAGRFIIFGALKHATVGLRIKSTGLRLGPAETWFGV